VCVLARRIHCGVVEFEEWMGRERHFGRDGLVMRGKGGETCLGRKTGYVSYFSWKYKQKAMFICQLDFESFFLNLLMR
jgi:hypothetical protein